MDNFQHFSIIYKQYKVVFIISERRVICRGIVGQKDYFDHIKIANEPLTKESLKNGCEILAYQVADKLTDLSERKVDEKELREFLRSYIATQF